MAISAFPVEPFLKYEFVDMVDAKPKTLNEDAPASVKVGTTGFGSIGCVSEPVGAHIGNDEASNSAFLRSVRLFT